MLFVLSKYCTVPENNNNTFDITIFNWVCERYFMPIFDVQKGRRH